MESLRQEAGRLLAEFGLLEILREYGEPHVIGSVSMDLMAWPDLDIDVLNTGMCLGITPVIGLTLPFVSYGGSSILTLYAMLGLVSGVYARPSPGKQGMYVQPPR